MHWFYIFIGAGLGGLARFASLEFVLGVAGWRALPFGTVFVNVFGSALMGLAFAALGGGERNSAAFAFIGTGFLGGFTTFSAFSLDAMRLIERGQLSHALGYIGGSVVLSIASLFLGLAVYRTLFD